MSVGLIYTSYVYSIDSLKKAHSVPSLRHGRFKAGFSDDVTCEVSLGTAIFAVAQRHLKVKHGVQGHTL